MARTRRSRRAGGILLLSVIGHGALLVWLIRSIPRPPAVTVVAPFQLSLVPDLQRPETATSQPAPVAPSSAPQSRHPAAAKTPSAAEPPASVTAPTPFRTESPPAPASPSASAVGATPAIGAGAGPDADAQAAVRHALRATLGCAHPDFSGLTVAERDDCSRQLGRQATIGAQENLERVPEEKRVYYAKVQKAYQDIRNYSGLSGVPIPGHTPKLGCRVLLGIPKGWKGTAQPPNSLKFGRLPCYLVPPAGLLTPEADLPTP